MNATAKTWYICLMLSYFGILGLLTAWYGWVSPATLYSPGATILMLTLPLFVALRGLLHARIYTVTWSLFLALIYMTHGIVEAFNEEQARWLAFSEIALALGWLGTGIMFIRTTKKAPASRTAP